MNYTDDLKPQLLAGIGNHKFYDPADGATDITEQILLKSVNQAMKRIARKKGFGELYTSENIPLIADQTSFAITGSVRRLLKILIYEASTAAYVAQVTNLPNGIYVDVANSLVYTADFTSAKNLTEKAFENWFTTTLTLTPDSGEPKYFMSMDKVTFEIAPYVDSGYFVRAYYKAWPTPYTNSNGSAACLLLDKEDLIVLLALSWLYNIKGDINKANQFFAQYRNEIPEALNAAVDQEADEVDLEDADDALIQFPDRALTYVELGINE